MRDDMMSNPDLSPFEKEKRWYKEVYQGDDVKQLTLRAVLMGGVLGSIMSLVNIYVGLKTGWGLGVAITACILSYSIWQVMLKIGLARTEMTILENNCMQSAASSAGYSTGGTMVSAIAAWMMLNNTSMHTGLLMAWVFFLAVLGVTLAIPMKRQMINIEQLKFPSGIAAAETLRSLHGSGGEAAKSATSLAIAGLVGGMVAIIRDGLGWLPGLFKVFGAKAASYTIAFEPSLLMIAAGAIMGLHTAASMLAGAILCWGILTPMMYHQGVITSLEYSVMVRWTLWGGVACMVTSGLLSFAMQWRTVVRAFSGMKNLFSGKTDQSVDDKMIERIEVPASWFLGGSVFGTIGVVIIALYAFGMPVWMSILAVIMSFFLALVACRATGETDTTPVGAMGKVTQLFYGMITPRSFAPAARQNVNLMAACITAGVADSSADLLIDLKSGYLLGANPRKQFLAQFSGIFFGTVFAVAAFQLIVPDPSHLGTAQFPAPAAQTWRGVAELLSKGLHSIHYTARWAIFIGGLVGLILPLLGRAVPDRFKWLVPSPMGLGMAFTFHFFYSLSMFIGAVIAFVLGRTRPKIAEEYTVPVASGLIAGESLAAIGVALYVALAG
ncbi:MAG: OPT family oligopeptide transporter [Deltaproteobacteria bacterium]|nr:OPT family oligopeptide transporter [Deltaproteobacteria bacterium]